MTQARAPGDSLGSIVEDGPADKKGMRFGLVGLILAWPASLSFLQKPEVGRETCSSWAGRWSLQAPPLQLIYLHAAQEDCSKEEISPSSCEGLYHKWRPMGLETNLVGWWPVPETLLATIETFLIIHTWRHLTEGISGSLKSLSARVGRRLQTIFWWVFHYGYCKILEFSIGLGQGHWIWGKLLAFLSLLSLWTPLVCWAVFHSGSGYSRHCPFSEEGGEPTAPYIKSRFAASIWSLPYQIIILGPNLVNDDIYLCFTWTWWYNHYSISELHIFFVPTFLHIFKLLYFQVGLGLNYGFTVDWLVWRYFVWIYILF